MLHMYIQTSDMILAWREASFLDQFGCSNNLKGPWQCQARLYAAIAHDHNYKNNQKYRLKHMLQELSLALWHHHPQSTYLCSYDPSSTLELVINCVAIVLKLQDIDAADANAKGNKVMSFGSILKIKLIDEGFCWRVSELGGDSRSMSRSWNLPGVSQFWRWPDLETFAM